MRDIGGWIVDLLVGWAVGSIVLGIAFGVIGAIIAPDSESGFSTAGVLIGTVVGIAMMRRRRAARAPAPSA